MKNFFRSSVLFNNSKRTSTLHLYKTRTSSGGPFWKFGEIFQGKYIPEHLSVSAFETLILSGFNKQNQWDNIKF